MRLYVGNLAFATTNDELKAAFEAFGAVESATVIMDRDTYLPIGDMYKETFQNYLDTKFLGK